jgi:hypothetical protein
MKNTKQTAQETIDILIFNTVKYAAAQLSFKKNLLLVTNVENM